jgi:hypothetical protein
MNSKSFVAVLLVTFMIGAMMVEIAEAACDTNGCCNCSRQTDGSCAAIKGQGLCTSGKCTCTSKLGMCYGSCGGSDLLGLAAKWGIGAMMG